MRSIPLPIKNIIKEVCEETGESYSLVEEILYHEFEFLRDCMEKGEKGNFPTYRNVLLKYLGTFYASEGKIEMIEKQKLAKKNRTIDGE